MHKNLSAGLAISVGQALSARNCVKRGEILSLGLLSSREDKQFLAGLKKIQGDYCGREEIFTVLDNYIKNQVKREWFKMDAQYEFIMAEEAVYQKELASFFIGRKCVASNIQWSVDLYYSIGKSKVSEIYGYAAAILEDSEDQYTALLISDGEPDYSPFARSFHKKPENAPELIGAYLGLSKTFGRNLKVIMAYTRPRRNKNENVVFSERTNIVTADFSACTEKDLINRMIKTLSTPTEEPDCELCRYSALCAGMSIPKCHMTETVSEKPQHSNPKFTKSQEKVVNFKEGCCAVYAVPGAGKTTTLVYRLVNLLRDGVNPKNILFVTFTNKACEEIRSRIKLLLNTEFEEELPDVFTFNGLGWQILRDNRDIVGDLKLLTSMDEKRLLMECIEAFPDELKGFSFKKIEGRFGLLSSLLGSFRNLDNENECEKESERIQDNGKDLQQILTLKQMLEKKIAEEQYITFDDQIILANKLFNDYPEILNEYAERWTFLMADEYQDASQDNADLLYALADAGKRNLVVVGDPDQSIYEWRDGSPEHLLHFKKSYPEAEEIYMKDNFRSVRQILEAAGQLISLNRGRINLSIIPHKDSKAVPYRVQNCGVKDVPQILNMLCSKNYKYGDISILSRNNAPLAKLKLLLAKQGIGTIGPSDYLIKDNFFILIKDILDLFFLGFSDITDLSFLRYLMACQLSKLPVKRKVKETFYSNCISYYGMSPIEPNNMESMTAYEVENIDMEADELFVAFKRLYELFNLFLGRDNPQDVIDAVLCAFQAESENPAVQELKRVLDYQHFGNILDFWNYLTYMVELEDDRKIEYEPEPDKLNLLTAHGSKGKEFSVVVVLQSEDFGTTEEERRLMYVAMTRAKKCLFVLESPCSDCELIETIKDQMNTLSLV